MAENDLSEGAPLDVEDWQIAFEPYQNNPGAALTLGFHLMALKAYLWIQPPDVEKAIEAIDNAVEALFPSTDFHNVSYELFRRVIDGKLSLEEEETLKTLGVKF